MSKYENIFKQAFFSYNSNSFSFRIKNETNDGYLLHGIKAQDLQNAIESHLYRISILNSKQGLNTPDYQNHYLKIGDKRISFKLVLQRLNRNIASDVRKAILDSNHKINSIKILGVYQIFQDGFSNRVEERMFSQKRMFLDKFDIKKYKPIWAVIFLNMLFVVEEDIKGIKSSNNALDYNPINYDNDTINIKAIPMKEIANIILNKNALLPVNNSYVDISELIKNSDTCLFCYRDKNNSSSDCCSELILENKLYFIIENKKGSYYLNPIRRDMIVESRYSRIIPNLKITLYFNRNTSYKGIIFGKIPVIVTDKSMASLARIAKIKKELSVARRLSA